MPSKKYSNSSLLFIQQLFSSLCLCLCPPQPLPPRPLSLWHRSVSADRCVSMGPACRSHPKEKKGRAPVPRILCGCPPLFSATCIQYCQTDCKPGLSRARRIARERAERRRDTRGEGPRRRRRRRRKGAVSIVSLAHYSPAFPSVSLSSFLFLWDRGDISNSAATSPNRGSHGREI